MTPQTTHADYYRPRPIEEQVARLQRCFPSLRSVDLSVAEQPLPEGAEHWFAIPRWEVLTSSYTDAVELVVRKLAGIWKGSHNAVLDSVPVERQDGVYLKQSARTQRMLARLRVEQRSPDLLVIPAQFGLRYVGITPVKARSRFMASEFGLGVFAVASMLLTHPDRMELGTDPNASALVFCAGDQYPTLDEGSVHIGGVPEFYRHKGQAGVTLQSHPDRDPDCWCEVYSSVSAFRR